MPFYELLRFAIYLTHLHSQACSSRYPRASSEDSADPTAHGQETHTHSQTSKLFFRLNSSPHGKTLRSTDRSFRELIHHMKFICLSRQLSRGCPQTDFSLWFLCRKGLACLRSLKCPIASSLVSVSSRTVLLTISLLALSILKPIGVICALYADSSALPQKQYDYIIVGGILTSCRYSLFGY